MSVQAWLVNPDPDWPGYSEQPDGEGWIWCANAQDILRRFGEPCDIEIAAGANEVERHEAFREVHIDYRRRLVMYETVIAGYVNSHGHLSVRAIALRGGAWVRRHETRDP